MATVTPESESTASPESTANPLSGVPTLYHLNASQSQCILWLLEELNIEYNVKLFSRDPKTHTAPTEVLKFHQRGTCPHLKTAAGDIIIESSAIIYYLLRTYDTNNNFAAQDPLKDEILTSFAGATLGPLITLEFVLDFAAKHTPWPFAYFSRFLWKQMQNKFTRKELKNALSWLQEQLEKQNGGGEYFNEEEIGRSDIMLTWPLDLIAARNWVDIRDYPFLMRWRTQIKARPAWKRALEKGNGYDMSAW